MRPTRVTIHDFVLAFACPMLAACDRRGAEADGVVVVHANAVAPTVAIAAPAGGKQPRPAPTPVATIAVSPPGPNPQLDRAAFRSPPLPPELAHDSGLVPLPPPPPPSAFGGDTRH